ncbi:DUF397 domain-containing protein [Actinomadura sp. WAC 06369]|uniref:DUF397 domain-containing protein n=1 Tax=Actinomadura sp. WAC 06369 TaxID=2203193 RepID=UPI000F7B68D2|nr:DUF397 domain-containing protein [Actinomadura sp. WAC 06369]RSN68114.1 DUF397 domain-containing protein [Actinomadura sp. WAC 06369]
MSAGALTWRKASRSTNNGGNCVELASFAETVAVRDSKDPEGARLLVERAAFAALLVEVKSGTTG